MIVPVVVDVDVEGLVLVVLVVLVDVEVDVEVEVLVLLEVLVDSIISNRQRKSQLECINQKFKDSLSHRPECLIVILD